MTCKATLAFEDDNGQLHKLEEDCCKSNERIKERKRIEHYMSSYRKIWPRHLDEQDASYYTSRGTRPWVKHFLEEILEAGYVIVEEKNGKDIIFSGLAYKARPEKRT